MSEYSLNSVVELIMSLKRKIIQMDEKLDRLLAEKESPSSPVQIQEIHEEEDVGEVVSEVKVEDYSVAEEEFFFTPIDQNKDVKYIANKMDYDDTFKMKLFSFMKSKPNLQLTDLFTPLFLSKMSLTKLKKLAPFNDIYVAIKRNKERMAPDQIKSLVYREIRKIKDDFKNEKFVQYNFVEENGEEQEENDEEVEDMDTDNGELEPGEIPVEVANEVVDNNGIQAELFFAPIANEADLKAVTNKLQMDATYKKNLRQYIDSLGDFKLTDIFTEEYLISLADGCTNLPMRLQAVIPFEVIYTYLKFMRGEPLEQIREAAYNEIIELRDSNCPEEDSDEIEISIDDPLQTICVEEEISIEEVQLDDCDDDEIKKSDLNPREFAPINNDKDLSLFVRKIKKSRKYRKEVQFKLIEEAPKGVLMLEQIFTLEFLQQFGAFHDFGRTRFMKLEPYKCLYQECKINQGFSIPEIMIMTKKNLKALEKHPKMLVLRIKGKK